MNTQEAINNLEYMSLELSRLANKQENYNSEFSHHLEVISYEMSRHASELKSIKSIWGV